MVYKKGCWPADGFALRREAARPFRGPHARHLSAFSLNLRLNRPTGISALDSGSRSVAECASAPRPQRRDQGGSRQKSSLTGLKNGRGCCFSAQSGRFLWSNAKAGSDLALARVETGYLELQSPIVCCMEAIVFQAFKRLLQRATYRKGPKNPHKALYTEVVRSL